MLGAINAKPNAADGIMSTGMKMPTRGAVERYYDEGVEGKLRDFTHFNPRIEAAIQTLAEWAPADPRRVLEIGCGIGATSWRMARAWPGAEVIGVDISSVSIDVARICFRLPNLTYHTGVVTEGAFQDKFDLILMMDVYEHIAPADRPAIHSAIDALLSNDSRLVMTLPTPSTQRQGREHNPTAMQPIDEDINVDAIRKLATDTQTELLYYRLAGIWNYGDYAHAVLGRFKTLAPVALRHRSAYAGHSDQIRRIFRSVSKNCVSLRDYLGSDMMRPKPRSIESWFAVRLSERRRLAQRWLSAPKHNDFTR
jgi:SAM-dependent methyltransferase